MSKKRSARKWHGVPRRSRGYRSRGGVISADPEEFRDDLLEALSSAEEAREIVANAPDPREALLRCGHSRLLPGEIQEVFDKLFAEEATAD